MTSNKFVLVGNGSYRNRGCEAIVCGTVKLLREAFAPATFVNANFDVASPPYVPAERDETLIHRPIPRLVKRSPRWLAARVLKHTFPRGYRSLVYGTLAPHLKDCRAALSIGGDNYSLDYGIPKRFIDLDRYILDRGVPLIIWGASVGPFDRAPAFAQRMHAHLRTEVRAIFVREQRSFDYLVRHGMKDKVFLMPDPAFLMEPTHPEATYLGFEVPEHALGLNLSPLMARYWTKGDTGELQTLGIDLITRLRAQFDRPIVLVPHVMSPRKNDFILLRQLYEGLDDRAGVFCLPDTLNAPETKAVIARLDCLLASRTHATIAAFSQCVPVVSLAYSVKAYGINERLFGHTDYLLEPDDFSIETLIAKAQQVLDRRQEIQETLTAYMRQVRCEATQAVETLKGILERT